MDEKKIISLENLNQYSDETSDKIKSYVDTKTSVIQDGTKAVGGVSAEDYNNFKSAYEDKHTHSNKSVLDEISEKTLNGGEELSGSTGYTVTDSVEYPIVGLKVFGKSTQDGTPTPENPVEITSVVEPTVTVCGKNLLGVTHQTTTKNGITFTNNSDGTYTLNGTATGEAVFTIINRLNISGTYKIIGCPPNGSNPTYNISVNVDGIWSINNYDIGNGSIINPSNYITIAIAIRVGVTCNNLVFKPMITTDLTATYDDFEQYKGNTATIPDTLNAIPVSSGGNVTIDGQEYIADYVDFERGVKVQRTSKITYSDGCEVKGIDVLGNYARIPILIDSNNSATTNNTKSLCDIMPYLLSYSSDSLHHYIQDKYIWAFVPAAELSTQDITGADEWLSIKRPTFIYELATPIETPLSESELQAYRQLQTYNGVTNISNDKGAGLSVEYCTSKALSDCVMPVTKDLQKQIDDLKAAVLSLGGNV